MLAVWPKPFASEADHFFAQLLCPLAPFSFPPLKLFPGSRRFSLMSRGTNLWKKGLLALLTRAGGIGLASRARRRQPGEEERLCSRARRPLGSFSWSQRVRRNLPQSEARKKWPLSALQSQSCLEAGSPQSVRSVITGSSRIGSLVRIPAAKRRRTVDPALTGLDNHCLAFSVAD